MSHLKKITALLVSAALISAFIMTGCGGSQPTQTTAAPEQTTASEDTKDTTAAPETTETEGVAAPEDNGQTFTFSVNTPQPAESAAGKLLQAKCDAITEATEGRITFELYFSGQLLTVFDTVTGVSSGVCDIAFLPTSTNPDFFPINGKLMILPFLGMPGDDSICGIYDELCAEFPEIEAEVTAQNMKTLSTFFFLREDLYFTGDKKAETTSDLSGQKIAVANAYVGKLLDKTGAAPVTVTQGDVYTTVESGVVDGLIHHDAFIRAGGAVELFKAVTMFGDDGMVREMGKFFMNLDSYNEMPQVLRDAIDNGFNELALEIMEADKKVSAGVQAEFEKNGVVVTKLSEEQVAPFKEAAISVQEECVKELDGQGINATAIYDKIKELVK